MTSSVVIVGAGPGGAATAIALAQRGIKRVTLLDRDEFPRDKTCGSGLSPNAIQIADELGIGSEVRRRGLWIRGMRMVTPGGREVVLAGGEVALVLLRKHFDNLLVERARALGVDFRPNFRALSLLTEGGRAVGVRSRDEIVRADYVVCADGAHSIFSIDPRPKRTISTLMGWWEGFEHEPGLIDMIFDRQLDGLYGWMFPETAERVNIGICMPGEDVHGKKTTRNVREVFQSFLDRYYKSKLSRARQVGRLKGHPISFTTWITHATMPGGLYIGEAARITHNATGEGIYQAMQSGIYAADALASVLAGASSEKDAWRRYTWRCRARFTPGFLLGHGLRALFRTPVLDGLATLFNNEWVREALTRTLGSALAGSQVSFDGRVGRSEAPAHATPPATAAATQN